MGKHFKHGGSTAKRDIACNAWHHVSEGLPRSSSSAAALGTALHEVIEFCQRDDLDPQTFAGKTVEGVLITQDHIDEKVIPALDSYDALMDFYGIEQYCVEVWAQKTDEVGGTGDFFGWSEDFKTVVMGDYKSGDGVMVYAEENDQLLFYMMCLRHEHPEIFEKAENLVLAIVQPSERREEFLDIWETDVARLNTFEALHDAAVLLTKTATEPVAGSHCTFCPAEAVCPAKLILLDEPLIPPEAIVNIERALEVAGEMKTWLKAVERFAHEALETGAPVTGWKLVNKRATRKWKDEKLANKEFNKLDLHDAVELKIKSPAQVEKICKREGIDWKALSNNVDAVSTGTTLARENDKRPAVMTVDHAALGKLLREKQENRV